MIRTRQPFLLLGAGCLLASLSCAPAFAREAAFLDPGNSGGGNVTDAVRVEPKNEMDMGDSPLNIARHVSLFFVNQTSAPIQIEKVTVNGDSNITTEIVNDDCSKQPSFAPGSRCSVEVSVTPTSGGTWNAEVLMTHNASGRIARAKILGKTSGAGTGDKREMGLFLSTKDVKPVDFGDVAPGSGKTVRTALMVNDSPEAITLYSIDVIEAGGNLQRLDQGCTIDMELKPGESCPVTLVWTPSDESRISTDLIIRHSGRLGFAVIPIRGTAKGPAGKEGSRADNGKNPPPPPTASLLEKMADVPATTASSLVAKAVTSTADVHLIGTVGTRALLYKPDGTTAVVEAGDEVDLGGSKLKVVLVSAKSAEVMIDGKKKQLILQPVSDLTSKAKAAHQDAAESGAGESSPVFAPGAVPASSGPRPSSTPLSAGGTK